MDGAALPGTAVAAAVDAGATGASSAVHRPGGVAVLVGARGIALAVGLASASAMAYVHARHRRARTHLAAVLAGQTEILDRITRGAPLDAILSALVEMVERHAEGMLCSVLLLEGNVLRYGAAPSLPATYREATHAIVIGPTVGSCGTAAYRRARVIVTDIAQDPLWKDFRDIALRHGLRACW